MKNMTICDDPDGTGNYVYLFNHEPARSFTDFRTTAEFKYIQHLQDQDEQE